MFVVRTISFKLLYGLVILCHARKRLVTISVASNPTSEWITGQVTEALPWYEAPRQLIRDRDRAFDPAYTHRIASSERSEGAHPIMAKSHFAVSSGHVSAKYRCNSIARSFCLRLRVCSFHSSEVPPLLKGPM